MKFANLKETLKKSVRNLEGTFKESGRNFVDFKPPIYTMATQPLETIPEETSAPAQQATTPARVTADPPKTKPATEKNHGRVASGKRLAERNRLAREAKKKAEAKAAKPAQPSGNTPAQSGDTSTESSSNSLMTILGVGGLLVSAAGVYYQREAIMERLKPAPPAPPAHAPPAPELPAPTPAPSRIPVKRGVRKME